MTKLTITYEIELPDLPATAAEELTGRMLDKAGEAIRNAIAAAGIEACQVRIDGDSQPGERFERGLARLETWPEAAVGAAAEALGTTAMAADLEAFAGDFQADTDWLISQDEALDSLIYQARARLGLDAHSMRELSLKRAQDMDSPEP